MFLYIAIMIIALFCTIDKRLRNSNPFLFFSLLILSLFVGCSDMLGGYDRYIYGEVFDFISDLRNEGHAIPNTFFASEMGYVVLNYLISFLTSNRYIFILTYTLVIYFLLYLSFKEYMTDYPLAIVMFLAMMFFFTFTYLREVMAVMIAWMSIKYIYNRKLLKFIFVILLAMSFHNSAIVLMPMYFIPIVRFNKRTVIVFMTILFLMGISPVPRILATAFTGLIGSGGQRMGQYDPSEESALGGIRIDYVLEAVFFLYIILMNYNSISTDKKKIVLQNTAIIFCGILLFFVRSSEGGRLSWYYVVGIIATICNILDFVKKSNLLFIMKTLCFLLFFRIVFYWGILLYPYKTFFTDGHRENDFIFYKYEYDHNYDTNKFYR